MIELSPFIKQLDGVLHYEYDGGLDWGYNPSMVWYRDKILISWRMNKYNEEGTQHYRSVVMLGFLNPDTLTLEKHWEVKYKGDHSWFSETGRGIEDVRLFVRDNQLYLIGTLPYTPNVSPESSRLAVCKLSKDLKSLTLVERLDYDFCMGTEKNWMPPVNETDKFDYSYHPTQVIKDGVKLGLEDHTYTNYHGGPPLLSLDNDMYLTVLHTVRRIKKVIGDSSKRRYYRNLRLRKKYNLREVIFPEYTHYFTLYNSEGFLEKLGHPFTFTNSSFDKNNRLSKIEFCSGSLDLLNGRFAFAVGLQDKSFIILSVNKEKLLKECFN